MGKRKGTKAEETAGAESKGQESKTTWMKPTTSNLTLEKSSELTLRGGGGKGRGCPAPSSKQRSESRHPTHVKVTNPSTNVTPRPQDTKCTGTWVPFTPKPATPRICTWRAMNQQALSDFRALTSPSSPGLRVDELSGTSR